MIADAAIFVLVDRAGLFAEVQARIDSGRYNIIPVYDQRTRDIIAEVQRRHFHTAAARDDFYGAVFGDAIGQDTVMVFTALAANMDGAERDLGLLRHESCILLPLFSPINVMRWLLANFTFPHQQRFRRQN